MDMLPESLAQTLRELVSEGRCRDALAADRPLLLSQIEDALTAHEDAMEDLSQHMDATEHELGGSREWDNAG